MAFIRSKGEVTALKADDIVHYDDSKAVGLIVGGVLKVKTAQFGEQELRFADIRSLRLASARDEVVVAAEPAPVNMMAFQNQMGQERAYTLTGAAAGATGIWGTDTYTLDSNLGAAAVHAGVLTPGQTATVKVRTVVSPAQFVASVRNGITSTGYGVYPAGAYEFVRGVPLPMP